MILTSGIFSALFFVKKEKGRIEELDVFLNLVNFILKNIEAFDMPICDILKKADGRILSLCNVSGYGEISIKEGVRLSNKERQLLLSFFSELGRGYREEQIKICKYYYGELSELAGKLSGEYPQKRKLIFTLCICASLGVIILFI